MDDPEIQVIDPPPTIHDVDMDEQHELMELTGPYPCSNGPSPTFNEVGTTGMTNPVPPVEESAVPVAAVPTSDVGCESDEPATDDEDSIQGPDLEDVANSSQDAHARLRKLIAGHLKKLRNKKTLLTDQSAANMVLDLEALNRYNDLRLQFAEKLLEHKQKIARAAPMLRVHLKRSKQAKIRPSMDASNAVATTAARGPHFARRLRDMASYILRTELLPTSNRGKGAAHPSLLNNPEVLSRLRQWVKGLIPLNQGGFEGRVSMSPFSFNTCPYFFWCRSSPRSFAVM